MASRTFANWDFWHLKGNTHPKAFKGSEKDVENLGKHEKTLKKNTLCLVSILQYMQYVEHHTGIQAAR